MPSKPQIIHEWKKPKKVVSYEADTLRKEGKSASKRILFISAFIITIVYAILKTFIPEPFEVSWEIFFLKISLALLVFAVFMLSCVYFLFPILFKNTEPSYTITEKRIQFRGASGSWFIFWKRLKGYYISQHENFPEITIINLCAKDKSYHLLLPETELAKDIFNTIDERIPLDNELSKKFAKIILTKKQWLFVSLIAIFYWIACIYSINTFKTSEITFPLSMLLLMLFGPGTISLLLIFKKRFFRNVNIIRLAYLINFISFFILMFLLFLFAIYLLAFHFIPKP